MSRPQLTLIQDGEFIVCEDVVYTAPLAQTPPPPRAAKGPHPRLTVDPAAVASAASLKATSATLPINTMKSLSVRIGDEIVPLPFIRSQERKAVSHKIIIDGPIATRIAQSLGVA
jgi:hypothetical protein